jgi:hypothetical protein
MLWRATPTLRSLVVLGLCGALFAPADALADSGPVDDESTNSGDDDDDRPPPPSVPPLVTFGAGLGSMRLASAGGLASYAHREGLGTLTTFAAFVEPTLTLTLERFVLPLRMRIASATAEGRLDADMFGGSIGVGYHMIRRPNFVVYPTISLGVVQTSLSVGTSADPKANQSFEAFAQSPGPATLSTTSLTGDASLDAQLRIVGTDPQEPRGLFIGAKVGITAPLARAPWTLEHRAETNEANDGPSPPVAGPSLALTLSARY